MKQLKTILSAVMVSSVVFMSCDKDRYDTTTASNGTNTNTAERVGLAQEGSIRWGTGSALVKGVKLLSENPVLDYNRTLDEPVRVDLLTESTPLARIPMEIGTYPSMSGAIGLDPFGERTSINLEGRTIMGDRAVTILVVINEPISIYTNFTNFNATSNRYVASLNVSLANLTTLLYQNGFADATVIDNTIKITRYNNTQLYQAILENMSSFMNMTLASQ